MARIRTIKPTYWLSDSTTELPICLNARYIFIGLISHADDEGYVSANLKGIRQKICGAGPEHDEDIKLSLAELERLGSIIRITIDEDDPVSGSFYWIPKFLEHQRVSKPQPSTIKKRIIEAGLDPDKVKKKSRPVLGKPTSNQMAARQEVQDMMDIWLITFPSSPISAAQANIVIDGCSDLGMDPPFVIAEILGKAKPRRPFAYFIEITKKDNPRRPELSDEMKRTHSFNNWIDRYKPKPKARIDSSEPTKIGDIGSLAKYTERKDESTD